MGEIVAVNNGKVDRDTNTENNRTSGGDCGSTNTTNTNTSGGRGTGGGIGGGEPTSGGTTKAEQSQEVLGVSLLTSEELERYKTADEKEQKRILKNARRRQQYAEQKKAGGQTVKPRKVRKGVEPTPPPIDTTSLSMIIATVSSVIASRPNCEHWLLTETEIKSIAEPLAKMIAESETLSNMTQYSNQIALVMACVTIAIPRIVITVEKQKEVKRIERTGQHTDTTVKRVGDTGKAQTSDSKPNRKNERNTPANGSNNGNDVPWYGAPIS